MIQLNFCDLMKEKAKISLTCGKQTVLFQRPCVLCSNRSDVISNSDPKLKPIGAPNKKCQKVNSCYILLPKLGNFPSIAFKSNGTRNSSHSTCMMHEIRRMPLFSFQEYRIGIIYLVRKHEDV